MNKKSGLFALLEPYKGLVVILLLFTILSNGLNLVLPKLIAESIDAFNNKAVLPDSFLRLFILVVLAIFLFSYVQSFVQTYVSERVARDLRSRLSDKIALQDNLFIERFSTAKLLTNFTVDIDSVKLFVAQAIVSIVSSLLIILGVSILLLSINWRLALCVIAIIPIISTTFFMVLKKVRPLFQANRKVIDWLNKVMSESILGAAIIRVVNAQQLESTKFLEANAQSKDYGLAVLRLFSLLIPIITFTANMASLSILAIGGHYVISGNMSLGDFAAFNSYLAMLIFPILVIGFMSNLIAQATASYERLQQVMNSPDPANGGTHKGSLTGTVEVDKLSLAYGQHPVLHQLSFTVKPGSRTAIVGPTAAGKTQLLYCLIGLLKPDDGHITFDGLALEGWERESFYAQVGFVFQDSVLFNMSIKDNISFGGNMDEASLNKAIQAAELEAFIASLPDKGDTIVSERGTSLSGGQKQRMMLARALARNPKILLLDDFTARVDNQTETRILKNIQHLYPHITLISVTQKIAAVTSYEQIILLMDGEIVAIGKHEELLHKSPEYVQIFKSQQSTSNYELQS